jgi:hypothetical protein
MANTEKLKNAIQKAIEKDFLKDNHNFLELSTKDRDNFKNLVLCKIEPDFYFLFDNTLYIGEITVSGFLHRKSHLGLSKKVTEAFSKFSLINHRFNNHQKSFSFNSIQCLFITPRKSEKSAFDSIGWRAALFDMQIMYHRQVNIDENVKNEIELILETSKEEN